MEHSIETRYRQRIFLGSAALAGVVLLLLRFYVIPGISGGEMPTWEVILIDIVDNLLAAVIAAFGIALILKWAIPQPVKTAKMEVVEPFRIRETLQEALTKTDEWWYRGQTGRHFRSATLPKLAFDARNENTSKSVYLLILDPTSAETCECYALYRQSIRSAKKDKVWTAERTRIELNATIVSAYAWKTKEPLLEVTVGLTSTVPLFRYDFSSRLALVTREDPQEPALRCDENTFFYRAFREDLRMSLQQSKILSNNLKFYPLEQITIQNTRELLTFLGLDNQNLNEESVREIISLVKKAENPYA